MDAQLRLIPRGTTPTSDSAAVRTPRRGRGDTTKVPTTVRLPRRAGAIVAEAPEAPMSWRIDESARQRGRAGISQAREALRHARRPLADSRHATAA